MPQRETAVKAAAEQSPPTTGSVRRRLGGLVAGLLRPLVRLQQRLEDDAVDGRHHGTEAPPAPAAGTVQPDEEHLAQEMSLACQIQQSLLPAAASEAGSFVCNGAYRAAAEVGGDYYDIFPLPSGRLGMVVADVSGKGLEGCMFAAMLAVLLRAMREDYDSPSSLLVDLEASLIGSLRPGTFVTVFYGILDPATSRLSYASAAHCPLLIYRAADQAVEWRRTGGIPLGAVPGGALARSLEDFSIDLRPGDLVLQFTDGLSEAWNAESAQQFGYERIARTVRESAPRGHEAVLEALCNAARDWAAPHPLEDDLTLLTIVQPGAPCPQAPAAASEEKVKARWFTPEEQLNEMLSDVPRLTIGADLAQLRRLRPWLENCPGIEYLSDEQKITIESGLFEICANIVEHGYEFEPDQEIDIWWVATGGRPCADDDATPEPAVTTSATGVGYFVICDQGQAFDPGSWEAPDLSDPAARRRSRGLGLQIVRSTTQKVVLVGNTPAGNLTMLHFDPPGRTGKEKVPHV